MCNVCFRRHRAGCAAPIPSHARVARLVAHGSTWRWSILRCRQLDSVHVARGDGATAAKRSWELPRTARSVGASKLLGPMGGMQVGRATISMRRLHGRNDVAQAHNQGRARCGPRWCTPAYALRRRLALRRCFISATASSPANTPWRPCSTTTSGFATAAATGTWRGRERRCRGARRVAAARRISDASSTSSSLPLSLLSPSLSLSSSSLLLSPLAAPSPSASAAAIELVSSRMYSASSNSCSSAPLAAGAPAPGEPSLSLSPSLESPLLLRPSSPSSP